MRGTGVERDGEVGNYIFGPLGRDKVVIGPTSDWIGQVDQPWYPHSSKEQGSWLTLRDGCIPVYGLISCKTYVVKTIPSIWVGETTKSVRPTGTSAFRPACPVCTVGHTSQLQVHRIRAAHGLMSDWTFSWRIRPFQVHTLSAFTSGRRCKISSKTIDSECNISNSDAPRICNH